MSEFQPFVMERMMSKWENVVDVNLSESGVHPMTLRELVELGDHDLGSVGDVLINYPQANGTVELRETIAALYPGATPENVLVTVGAAEANFLTMKTLLQPGDEAVIMLPNYMQVSGIARNHRIQVRECHLSEELGWAPDLAGLEAAATPKTRLIAVCNPNNPTGRIMTDPEMDAVVAVAERTGAWLLADEVYRGRGARNRRRDSELLRTVREGHRQEEPEQGLRPAGPPNRLVGRTGETPSTTCGHGTSTRPSPPRRSRTTSRPSRSRRRFGRGSWPGRGVTFAGAFRCSRNG